MVVLVVGILSSVVLLGLNPGGPERKLDDEAERLASLLALASSEAVMQNREFGVRVEEQAYHFLCMEGTAQHWKACTGDGLLKAHELPEGLELNVLSAGRVALPAASDGERPPLTEKKPELLPDILLLSSGEASPTELEIRVADEPSQRVFISMDEVGRVRWGALDKEVSDHAD